MTSVVPVETWVDIPERWSKLVKWVKDNGYLIGDNQCLEEHLFLDDEEQLKLDPYLSIEG